MRERGALKRLRRSRALWPLLALALLWLLNGLFTAHFLDLEWRDGRLYGAQVDVLRRAAPVLLLAVGMTPVIGSGGIDLSVGAVMAMVAAGAAWLLSATALPAPAVVALGLLAGAALGSWNGGLVALLRLQPIVATLVLLTAGRGLALLTTGGRVLTFERPAFEALAGGALLGLPLPLWIGALVALGAALAMRRTLFGRYVEAVGDNEAAARLCGLPVGRVKWGAYAASGALAALAGLIAAADIGAADVHAVGLYLELDAILAVVIGGTKLSGGRTSVVGSAAGAVLLQLVTTALWMRGMGAESTLVLKAACVLLVVSLQGPGFARGLARLRGPAGSADARAEAAE